MVMVAQPCEWIKIVESYFKRMDCVVCELYLNNFFLNSKVKVSCYDSAPRPLHLILALQFPLSPWPSWGVRARGLRGVDIGAPPPSLSLGVLSREWGGSLGSPSVVLGSGHPPSHCCWAGQAGRTQGSLCRFLASLRGSPRRWTQHGRIN